MHNHTYKTIKLTNASVVSALNNKADIELENSTRASEIASLANSAHTAAIAAQTTADAANTLINTSLTEMNAKIDAIEGNVPVGFIVPFSGNTVPNGFLLCNGASISKTTYSKLYNVIGTTYGSIDEDHFNIPDLTDGRYIQGSTTSGLKIEEGLPGITGTVAGNLGNDANGAFYTDASTWLIMTQKGTAHMVKFNASLTGALASST